MLAEEPETQLSGTMSGLWRSLDVFNNKHPFQSWRDDGRGLLRRGAALHRLHSPWGHSINDVCKIEDNFDTSPHLSVSLSCNLSVILYCFWANPSWTSFMEGPQSAVGTDGEGGYKPWEGLKLKSKVGRGMWLGGSRCTRRGVHVGRLQYARMP